METIEVNKSAMRRLINAVDIKSHALSRGQMKRYAMACHAERIISPEVDREIVGEMLDSLRGDIVKMTTQLIRA